MNLTLNRNVFFYLVVNIIFLSWNCYCAQNGDQDYVPYLPKYVRMSTVHTFGLHDDHSLGIFCNVDLVPDSSRNYSVGLYRGNQEIELQTNWDKWGTPNESFQYSENVLPYFNHVPISVCESYMLACVLLDDALDILVQNIKYENVEDLYSPSLQVPSQHPKDVEEGTMVELKCSWINPLYKEPCFKTSSMSVRAKPYHPQASITSDYTIMALTTGSNLTYKVNATMGLNNTAFWCTLQYTYLTSGFTKGGELPARVHMNDGVLRLIVKEANTEDGRGPSPVMMSGISPGAAAGITLAVCVLFLILGVHIYAKNNLKFFMM